MRTAEKRVNVFIDTYPLAHSEDKLVYSVWDGESAPSVSPGTRRYKAQLILRVPITEEHSVEPESDQILVPEDE